MKSGFESMRLRIMTRALASAFGLLRVTPDFVYVTLFSLSEKLLPTPTHRHSAKKLKESFQGGGSWIGLVKRTLASNRHARRALASFIVRSGTEMDKARVAYKNKYGETPPYVLLISPSMRCNLRCEGCFASEYGKGQDMDEALVRRVIREANEYGGRLFIILGGEPFVYGPLWDIIKDNPDSIFQIYTNGSLLTEENVERIARLGNVLPTLSLEGFEKETDERRGPGSFKTVMEAMDRLHRAKVPFFFSATATRKNFDAVTSEDFIDLMVEKGALMGWYFMYMPVGREPNLELMLTPEQRNRLRQHTLAARKSKPMTLVDFWGDGPVSRGCISGGRFFAHVNTNGDLEPCIFNHMAVDNVKEKSLAEALNSDFFRAIRRGQPYHHNELRPCPLIDHPGVMEKLARRYGAKPTHAGADSMFNELMPDLTKYAEHVKEVYDPVWEREYAENERWVNYRSRCSWLPGERPKPKPKPHAKENTERNFELPNAPETTEESA